MNFRFACLLTLPAALTFASCQKTPSEPAPTAATCATPATVRDLTGLDGCGKVLVLADGRRLQPMGSVWQRFQSHDGQNVYIAFTLTSGVSSCMVGPTAELSCIREASLGPSTSPSGN